MQTSLEKCDPVGGEWFSPGRFALLLGLLVAVCFPGILIGSESFVLRDFTLFGYPLAHFHRESFWDGEWPLWNPYNHCGLPFLAQWNTLCLYPLSLVYLLLPLAWGMGLFCLLHLYAGGLGFYWLARDRTGSGFAGAVAGVLYAFNGLTQTSLMWPNNIAALGWLPWVLLLFDRGVRRGGRWLFGAALAGGMQMLCGAPEMILMTWAIGGIGWCTRVGVFGVELRRLVLVVGLVAGVSAVQLLPFFDLLARSSRAVAGAGSGWGMGADGWAHLFVPLYRTVRAPTGFYAQVDQFWTLSYFAGVCGVVFALMAWRCAAKRRDVVAWWLLVLGSLALASGESGVLYPLLRAWVPLEVMRFPVKFVAVLTVAVPMLAAYGAAPIPCTRRPVECLAVLGLVLLVAVRIPGAVEFGELRRDWMDSALLRAVFLVALAIGVAGRSTFRNGWWGLIALLICFADLRTHSPGLTPTVPVIQVEVERAEVEFPELGQGRIAVTRGVERLMRKGVGRNHAEETQARRLAGLPNLNLVAEAPSVGGFYSLRLAREVETSRRLYQSLNDVHAPLGDFMGVTQASVAGQGLGWKQRMTAEPLVTIGRRPVFLSEEQILERMASDEFRPGEEVLLPLGVEGKINARTVPDGTVVLEHFGGNRVAFRSGASGEAIVAIAQSWHPNWRALINGEAAELLRVNHSFQGVVVPAGECRVELVYQDRQFALGGVVSLASLMVVGLGLARRRHKKGDSFIEPPVAPLLV